MKRNRPFVTIITCTYNSEKFIGKNLQSVKKQNFTNFEHIFIDGESKDNTMKLLQDYKKHSKYHIEVLSKPARGISNAFNEGIMNAKGNYTFFLNSDDYFYDEKVLSDVVIFLKKHKNFDWIYGKINLVEESGQSVGSFPERKIFQSVNKTLLKYINFIPHQAVFMKRSIFSEFGGFDESLTSKMDLDLWLRLAGKTRWIFFNRTISNFTVRKGAKSSSKQNILENRKNQLKVLERHLGKGELVISKLVECLCRYYSKVPR